MPPCASSITNESPPAPTEDTAAAWDKYDWLRGQTISVDQSDGQMKGICRGIDTDGALILQTDSGRQRVISGSVSFSEQAGGIS